MLVCGHPNVLFAPRAFLILPSLHKVLALGHLHSQTGPNFSSYRAFAPSVLLWGNHLSLHRSRLLICLSDLSTQVIPYLPSYRYMTWFKIFTLVIFILKHLLWLCFYPSHCVLNMNCLHASCVWTLGPLPTALIWKAMDPSVCGTFMKQVICRWALRP